LPVNGKSTTVVNSCCCATTVGTVVLFVVSSRDNNGPTQQSKCFLCGPVPGYITSCNCELLDVVGGLVLLLCEEGRPKAVRDKVAGKGQQQYY
jgi:hypothetical protein